MIRTRLLLIFLVIVVSLGAGALITLSSGPKGAIGNTGLTPQAGERAPLAGSSGPNLYHLRVNAGGGTLGDWVADQAYVPGEWGYVGGRIFGSATAVAAAADPAMYQTERWGMAAYKFHVPNGQYRVQLYFAEVYYKAPGKRVFGVNIENRMVLSDYDIYQQVGFAKAAVQIFEVSVGDGLLSIDFISKVEHPKISGISIEQLS